MKNYFQDMTDVNLLSFYTEWNNSVKSGMMIQHPIVQVAMEYFNGFSKMPMIDCQMEMLNEIAKRWYDDNI